jgi:hypothetical protein
MTGLPVGPVTLFEVPYFLADQIAHAPRVDEDVHDGQSQGLGRCQAGQPLKFQEPERLPSAALDAEGHTGHCLVAEFQVKLLGESDEEVFTGLLRIQRLEDSVGEATAPGLGEVAPGVPRQRLQPGPEAARRVILKGPQLLGQPQQHVLGHVLCVGLGQSPLAAPEEDARAVAIDELAPRRLVCRYLSQSAKQGRAGGRSLGQRHCWYSEERERPTRIIRTTARRCKEEATMHGSAPPNGLLG